MTEEEEVRAFRQRSVNSMAAEMAGGGTEYLKAISIGYAMGMMSGAIQGISVDPRDGTIETMIPDSGLDDLRYMLEYLGYRADVVVESDDRTVLGVKLAPVAAADGGDDE